MKKELHSGLMHSLAKLDDYLLQVLVYDTYSDEKHTLILFEDEPPAFFEALQPLQHFVRRNRLPQPLILNRLFIEGSLDSYPLEFLNMQTSYQNLLANADILKNLTFAKRDIRLQMERELRSKWLLTKQAVLASPFKTSHLRKVMLASRRDIHPVLKGFFALSERPVPQKLDTAIEEGQKITGCQLQPLIDTMTGLNELNHYLSMLEQLIIKIQDWKL